jgi:hypothetical protein
MHKPRWVCCRAEAFEVVVKHRPLLYVPFPDEHSLLPENSSWEEPRHTRSELTVFLLVGLGTLQER